MNENQIGNEQGAVQKVRRTAAERKRYAEHLLPDFDRSRYTDGLNERGHWLRIRTTNPIERINREIRRRTRVVGCFPDGDSAVMLVAARLRHVTGAKWGTKQYMDITRLQELEKEAA